LEGVSQIQIKRNDREQAMFAKVSFSSVNNMEKASLKLNNVWLQDKLLKVRSLQHAQLERKDDRTVVVQKLPKYFSNYDLREYFSQFGNVLSVDFPQVSTLTAGDKNLSQVQKDLEHKKEIAFHKALASQRFSG